MKKVLSLLIMLAFVTSINAQDDRPFRIGLKLGVPNLAGLGVEYAIMDHIAVAGDLSYFPLELDEYTEFSYTYIGLGGNYYLDKNNKGIFVGAGIGVMSFAVTETGIFNSNSFDNDGSGEFSIDLTLIKMNIGYRWIWGAFSLTPEVGYALGSIDDNVEYTATFPDGSTPSETTFALTIGFAF